MWAEVEFLGYLLITVWTSMLAWLFFAIEDLAALDTFLIRIIGIGPTAGAGEIPLLLSIYGLTAFPAFLILVIDIGFSTGSG